jgi:Ni,Fe-hydrogenase I cytochrome b subunit
MFVNNTGLSLTLITYFGAYLMVINTILAGLFLLLNKPKTGLWFFCLSWFSFLFLSYTTAISQALFPVDLAKVFGENFNNANTIASNFVSQIYYFLLVLAFILAGFKIYKFVLKSKLKLKDLWKNAEFWYTVCGLMICILAFPIVSVITNLI